MPDCSDRASLLARHNQGRNGSAGRRASPSPSRTAAGIGNVLKRLCQGFPFLGNDLGLAQQPINGPQHVNLSNDLVSSCAAHVLALAFCLYESGASNRVSRVSEVCGFSRRKLTKFFFAA
jgi:hypothetical protein